MSLKNIRKKAETDSELLDNLTAFLEDFENLSEEELTQELRDEGIDPEQLLTKSRVIIKSKLKDAKLSWKKSALERRQSLLEQMSSFKHSIPKSIEDVRNEIKALLTGGYGTKAQAQAQAFFRNLDEVTDEDLKSFYEDLKKLELLEKKSSDKTSG